MSTACFEELIKKSFPSCQANTMAQMVRAMRAIMSMESLSPSSTTASPHSRGDEGGREDVASRQPTLEEEIDALEV